MTLRELKKVPKGTILTMKLGIPGWWGSAELIKVDGKKVVVKSFLGGVQEVDARRLEWKR